MFKTVPTRSYSDFSILSDTFSYRPRPRTPTVSDHGLIAHDGTLAMTDFDGGFPGVHALPPSATLLPEWRLR